MDKRLYKTNKKILIAFKNLLKTHDYSEIIIEDIIQEAKIVRSTFYRHYKTKNDVLDSVCKDIFDHVFSHALQEEKSHDFSKSSILDYKHYITHIFYHLDDENELLHAILNSEAKSFFIDSLKKEFKPFANICLKNKFFNNSKLPEKLMLESILANFILVINYWDQTNFSNSPEMLTEYFIILNNK